MGPIVESEHQTCGEEQAPHAHFFHCKMATENTMFATPPTPSSMIKTSECCGNEFWMVWANRKYRSAVKA